MPTTTRQIVQRGIVTEEFGSRITGVNHIDTYQTFQLAGECFIDSEVGELFEDLGLEMDDLEWETDYFVSLNKFGWLNALADLSIDVIRAELGDDDEVILSVGRTSEDPYSPSEYNFMTDGYQAVWRVNTDKLEDWLTENSVVIHDGSGISGFIRTADDETWYLGHAIAEYLEMEVFANSSYEDVMWQWIAESSLEHDYARIHLTERGVTKAREAGCDPEAIDRWSFTPFSFSK